MSYLHTLRNITKRFHGKNPEFVTRSSEPAAAKMAKTTAPTQDLSNSLQGALETIHTAMSDTSSLTHKRV